MHDNPNLDLVNVNVYAKFHLIASIFLKILSETKLKSWNDEQATCTSPILHIFLPNYWYFSYLLTNYFTHENHLRDTVLFKVPTTCFDGETNIWVSLYSGLSIFFFTFEVYVWYGKQVYSIASFDSVHGPMTANMQTCRLIWAFITNIWQKNKSPFSLMS